MRRGTGTATISCDEIGMTVTLSYKDGSVSQTRLRWQDVNGVVAYKRDLATVDLICLGFSSPMGGVEVHEEMQGWDALTDALPAYLSGVPSSDQWWGKVAQPPFTTNLTKLYPHN